MFSFSMDLPTLDISHEWNQIIYSFLWLTSSLNKMFSRFIHVVAFISTPFLLYRLSTFHSLNIYHFFFPCNNNLRNAKINTQNSFAFLCTLRKEKPFSSTYLGWFPGWGSKKQINRRNKQKFNNMHTFCIPGRDPGKLSNSPKCPKLPL